ncbi:hypothetical protein SASPL_100307 [Salvia splendens]|uniref:Transitional endoplasmic reticulum ATPase n=1 Tax=Salvia splendens TaxID=180675 RepID=A0A8X9ABG5_SALSN|nr:hypothetical protein SASPL_100307 [Salvia splendens]
MEKSIVTQLMTSMDESHVPVEPAGNGASSASSNSRPGYILVIGATNRPDAMDPELRRPARFDREIALGVPNEAARIEILSMLTRKHRLEGAIDLQKIARLTPGFTGADLTAIAHDAGILAKKGIAGKKRDELSKEEKDEDHSGSWVGHSNLLFALRPSWLRKDIDRQGFIREPILYTFKLLVELDGSDPRSGVYVIGATNSPKVMDEAMLRPGRFGKLMYVPLPSPDERGMILKALARNRPVDANVDLMALAKHSDKFSSADLLAANVLRDQPPSMDTSSSIQWTIKETHFMRAGENLAVRVGQGAFFSLTTSTILPNSHL